ncbi:invertebrate gustatory receptor [Holotrichia oblita]|uniref:Invertebrate gustatory receptor n=1 Tax=Holotrichia oblita TaxID=644536 RepID=A0ACB9TEA1_HOLOL|nr:invertebrate gustatory receptor [Holotrichia oblita]
MYRPTDVNNLSFLGSNNNYKPKKSVYLEGASVFYQKNKVTQVAPALSNNAQWNNLPYSASEGGVVQECLKPIIMLERSMGIFPISVVPGGFSKVTLPWMIYSVFVFLLILSYIGYIKWDKVEIVRSTEGKFEEAVIDYLFTVYLIPVVIIPIAWYESSRMASVFSEWMAFERIYQTITHKKLPLFMGNKPLLVTLGLPILSCGTMVVTHITMVHFRIVQDFPDFTSLQHSSLLKVLKNEIGNVVKIREIRAVPYKKDSPNEFSYTTSLGHESQQIKVRIEVVPYCFINAITYIVGGMWYLHCDLIGRVATVIANDFETALHHIGPSVRVAEYRSLWMMLGKLTRNVGLGSCYVITFLCLYLFLIITLTIYGLLSQIQDGLGVKDVGLTITAFCAIGILYFVCDEAHYASNCVRVNFQKKLLLVELSWMNDDAQQESKMAQVYGVYDFVFGHLNIPEYIIQKIYSSKLHRRDLEFLAAFACQNEKYFTFEDLIEVLEECNPYFNEETRHVIRNEFNWLREPCSDVPAMTYMYNIATRSVLSLTGKAPQQNGNIVWEPPHENPILSNEEVCDFKQYDNFIENALQMREDAIAREKQLIGQSSYFLNKSGSKWLTVGLSPAARFIPIVQIKSVNTYIFFTQEEWEEFCKTEGCSPNHQMEASSYRDIQVIRLKSRGQQIVLSTETYNNIYHLQELINQKISILASSDFVSFYNHVLKSCTKMDGDLYSNIITLLATHINSQNTMYMLEVLYITYNTVFLDFEIMNCW